LTVHSRQNETPAQIPPTPYCPVPVLSHPHHLPPPTPNLPRHAIPPFHPPSPLNRTTPPPSDLSGEECWPALHTTIRLKAKGKSSKKHEGRAHEKKQKTKRKKGQREGRTMERGTKRRTNSRGRRRKNGKGRKQERKEAKKKEGRDTKQKKKKQRRKRKRPGKKQGGLGRERKGRAYVIPPDDRKKCFTPTKNTNENSSSTTRRTTAGPPGRTAEGTKKPLPGFSISFIMVGPGNATRDHESCARIGQPEKKK